MPQPMVRAAVSLAAILGCSPGPPRGDVAPTRPADPANRPGAQATLEVGATTAPAGAARAGGDRELGPIARAAAAALKADLAAFEVHLYSFPPGAAGRGLAGSPDDDPTWVKLVTDPKRAAARPKQVFAVTEGQAAGLIDHLAETGVFATQATDPPGIAYVGWYVVVTGGKPAGRRGYWRYDPDVKPETVPVMQFLARTLDGDAKAAVENFRKDASRPKK
jgi:hypothetical protein